MFTKISRLLLSFYYEQEQILRKRSLQKELFVGDIWWNKTAVVDIYRLIVLYLRDKYLISLYSAKTFKSRQVIEIKKFITWVIMSDFSKEKHSPWGDLGKFRGASDYGKKQSEYEPWGSSGRRLAPVSVARSN